MESLDWAKIWIIFYLFKKLLYENYLPKFQFRDTLVLEISSISIDGKFFNKNVFLLIFWPLFLNWQTLCGLIILVCQGKLIWLENLTHSPVNTPVKYIRVGYSTITSIRMHDLKWFYFFTLLLLVWRNCNRTPVECCRHSYHPWLSQVLPGNYLPYSPPVGTQKWLSVVEIWRSQPYPPVSQT